MLPRLPVCPARLPPVPQDEDEGASLADLLATHRGRLTVIAELAALAAMLPFLVLEWATIQAYGWCWCGVGG